MMSWMKLGKYSYRTHNAESSTGQYIPRPITNVLGFHVIKVNPTMNPIK